MKRQMTRAKRDGYRIIYLDETMFTRKTVAETEWALPGENMTVDQAKLDEPTLALLAAISKDKGLEHYRVFPKSVDAAKFIEWLRELRDRSGNDKIALFLDNLPCHRSDDVRSAMRELGFRWIFNVPYSPQYNPIELTFSQLKRNF